MRILDLFCGAGGAGWGYHLAGFSVLGVDIDPQPSYPFSFFQHDALEVAAEMAQDFDAVHASPPCQGYTTMNNRHGSSSPLLIDEVRDLLQATGKPWVIENVVGARSYMRHPVLLHGGMFGLDVYRPRLFETNWLLMSPPRAKRPEDAAAIYGKNDGRRLFTRVDGSELRVATLERAREAMEMPWADWHGVKEAIPPAYTRWIGERLLEVLS